AVELTPPPFPAPKRPRSHLPRPPQVLLDLLGAAPGHWTAAAAANRRRRRSCSAEPPPPAVSRPNKATPRLLSPPTCSSSYSPSPPAAAGAGIRLTAAAPASKSGQGP